VDWNTIASVATAIGVAIGVWQIREGAKIAQAQFEDALDQQYRSLAEDIPVDALLDWSDGIRDHLEKPAFQKVWIEVKSEAPGTFSFLERLEDGDFKIDPRRWS
jgi:hypothetical protein